MSFSRPRSGQPGLRSRRWRRWRRWIGVACSSWLALACATDDDDCGRAADLCGASLPASSDHCDGPPRAFAACLLANNDCSVTTQQKCARDAARDGGPTSPPDTAALELEILKLIPSETSLELAVRVRYRSGSTPLPLSAGLFSIEDGQHRLHTASVADCAAQALAAGGNTACELTFALLSGVVPTRLWYRGVDVEAVVDLVASGCPLSSETTAQACSDGCSNDGDTFVDCDDFDCCAVRDNCPKDTACGKQPCQTGREASAALCRDGCDNDRDTFIDCDDFDCCAARPDCPATSSCGRQASR